MWGKVSGSGRILIRTDRLDPDPSQIQDFFATPSDEKIYNFQAIIYGLENFLSKRIPHEFRIRRWVRSQSKSATYILKSYPSSQLKARLSRIATQNPNNFLPAPAAYPQFDPQGALYDQHPWRMIFKNYHYCQNQLKNVFKKLYAKNYT